MLPLPVLHAPGSQAWELCSFWGSRREEQHLPCAPARTQSPLTHYVAVVSLSHEQHAANKVSGGHALSAFAFPAGDKQRMKQKPQELSLCLPTITTGMPVAPDQSKPGAVLRKSSFSSAAFIRGASALSSGHSSCSCERFPHSDLPTEPALGEALKPEPASARNQTAPLGRTVCPTSLKPKCWEQLKL